MRSSRKDDDCKSNKKDDDDCKCDHHRKDDDCKFDHHEKMEECCCKKSMKEALDLLLNRRLKSDVKFDEFAFIGHNFLVGAPLKSLVLNDNISTLRSISRF